MSIQMVKCRFCGKVKGDKPLIDRNGNPYYQIITCKDCIHLLPDKRLREFAYGTDKLINYLEDENEDNR